MTRTDAGDAGGAPGARRPNLLFVMADEWRRMALGCMGEDPVETPHFDRFAAGGRLFTNALSVCPVCVPARASILTGRYPVTNRVIHNGRRLPDDERSIGTILQQAGYATGYIGKWHLDGRHHQTQYVPPERRHGFDFWHAANMPHHLWIREYYAAQGPEPGRHVLQHGWSPDHETDVAIDFITRHARQRHAAEVQPFALFLSWTPPHPGRHHAPGPSPAHPIGEVLRNGFVAPPEYEARYAGLVTTGRPNYAPVTKRGNSSHGTQDAAAILAGYFGAVTSLDDNFARLAACLEREGLVEDTIVVLHADHGEQLGSHGRTGKHIWYEESVGVPFVVGWPGQVAPGREEALFNQVDIVPTLLGLMDVPAPPGVEGTDFAPLLRGQAMPRPDSALLSFCDENDHPSHSNWRCLRTPGHSYVVTEKGGRVERIAYDLLADPYQLRPIRPGEGGQDALLTALHQELRAGLERTDDDFAPVLRP